MRPAKVVGLLVLIAILASGCIGGGDNYSNIYYSTDFSGQIYGGEDCLEGCDKYLDTLDGGLEHWDQPYTSDEWNESINLNMTEIVQEALPAGYSRIDVHLDDKFKDGENEYYLQYKADIIYPTQKISILYKAWIVRK